MFANLLKVINDNGSTFLNVSPWRKMRARHDYSKFNHIISRQVKHIWIIETNILWWSFRKLGLTCWLRLMLLIECGTVENSREWWIARRAVSMLVCVRVWSPIKCASKLYWHRISHANFSISCAHFCLHPPPTHTHSFPYLLLHVESSSVFIVSRWIAGRKMPPWKKYIEAIWIGRRQWRSNIQQTHHSIYS